jgi:HK97 family phage portal protein
VGFLDRVIAGAETRSATSGLAHPTQWLLDAFGSRQTYTGDRVSVEKAFGLAPVYSAVRLISETVGSLPLKVFRELEDGERIEARQHRAWRILHDAPNPVTPAYRFWSTVTGHLLLWGNAFIEKRRDLATGLVSELYLLAPSATTVEWNGQRKRFISYMPNRREFNDDQVLHITAFSLDGLVGRSVIETCAQAFGTAMARERYEGNHYANGGVPRVFLEHPGQLTRDAKERLSSDWKTIYSTTGAAVLEEGMKANGISLPMADLEFVANQQLSRTDIAIMFGLPPAFLGGTTGDSLTYATVEGNQIQFAQQAIVPLTNVIGRSLSEDFGLFPQTVQYAEFVIEGLLRGDMKARAEFYKTMSEINAITPNEIRARENLPALDGGDTPTPVAGQSAPLNGAAPDASAMAALAAAVGNGNGNGNG